MLTHATVVRRRILTFAAIAMMISSALISFFLVQRNDHAIAELKRMNEQTEQTISTLWNNAITADRNADAAIIVLLLAKDSTNDAMELKRYFATRAGVSATAGNMEILKSADETRKAAGDRINDLYIKQLSMENEIMARESSNKRYADFAFLLQLISLVLVILTREMPNV